MIPELGHFALIIALALAIVQGVAPFVTARTTGVSITRTCAITQALLITAAFAALMHGFITSDFSLYNVAANSHSSKPMIYKIAATWGSHEGSLLLWVLILAIFGAGVAIRTRATPDFTARVLSVQAWITTAFLLFLLLGSNPFLRLDPAPIDGNDLNPLLQDIGLVLHPPLLYLGYVGFSIVFSFAIAALLDGRIDAGWARMVRPWILIAWVCLTAGISLGSWWAYYELGWGGWWFWDPVENVSFMPWLLGTALLHSAIVMERRDAFRAWTLLLAILTFSLSLFGTFIVRSGVLTSVHAFALDPERGVYLLALMGIATGGALILFAIRAPLLTQSGVFAPISRETGLMLNNLFLMTATLTVFFGTVYPLVLEALVGEKISVGPPFFNKSFVPICLPLIILMGIGPFLSWKRADMGAVLARLKGVFLLSVIAVLALWYWRTEGPLLAVLSMGAGVWLFFATCAEFGRKVRLFDGDFAGLGGRMRRLPRAAYGMSLAHLGMAICIFGFVGSSAWKQDATVFANDSVRLAGFELRMTGLVESRAYNYISQTGTVDVYKNGVRVTVLYPERRFYLVAESTTTESDIYQHILGDLYVSISESSGSESSGTQSRWILRVSYHPLVNFIWFGAGILVLGGLVSLGDRRLRIGAPAGKIKDKIKGAKS